ncbi:MAG: polysaccharide deacetylase family protein, partial [Terriglobales bacterium]
MVDYNRSAQEPCLPERAASVLEGPGHHGWMWLEGKDLGRSRAGADRRVFGCIATLGRATRQFAAHVAVIAKQKPPVRALPRITFDDGVQSQFRHALPILRQNSVAATFFVNTGLIGVVPEYMDWAQ